MKKNKYSFITIGIALIISIIYYAYICNCVEDKKWDTLTNFITTILSIIIGAMVSIIIYNHQRTKEANQKLDELKLNLNAELNDMYRILTNGTPLTVNSLNFIITYIEPINVIECAKSGLFNSIEVENLLHFSRKVRLYNVFVKYFLSIISSPNSPNFTAILTHCHGNINTSINAIIADIRKLKTQFGLE